MCFLSFTVAFPLKQNWNRKLWKTWLLFCS